MAGKFIFCSLFFSVYALCLNVSECVSFLQLFGPLNQQVARLTLLVFSSSLKSVWVCWCFHSVRRLRVYVGCFRVYFHLRGDNNNTPPPPRLRGKCSCGGLNCAKNPRQTPFRGTIPCRQPATLFALILLLVFRFRQQYWRIWSKNRSHWRFVHLKCSEKLFISQFWCLKNCHRKFSPQNVQQVQADEAWLRICSFPGTAECKRKLFTTELW